MDTSAKVLFVCLGNICRSPLAQGIFQSKVDQAGLSDQIHVDSAGTGDFNIGKPPDPRAIKVAQSRDIDISHLRGRQISQQDVRLFDYILAMDFKNLDALNERFAARDFQSATVRLLMDYVSGNSPLNAIDEIPDPYTGTYSAFERTFDLIEVACERLLTSMAPDIRMSG